MIVRRKPTVESLLERLARKTLTAPSQPLSGSAGRSRGYAPRVAAEGEVEVEHGLGVVPTTILLTIFKEGRIGNLDVYVMARGRSKFTIRNSSSVELGVMWEAIT